MCLKESGSKGEKMIRFTFLVPNILYVSFFIYFHLHSPESLLYFLYENSSLSMPPITIWQHLNISYFRLNYFQMFKWCSKRLHYLYRHFSRSEEELWRKNILDRRNFIRVTSRGVFPFLSLNDYECIPTAEQFVVSIFIL